MCRFCAGERASPRSERAKVAEWKPHAGTEARKPCSEMRDGGHACAETISRGRSERPGCYEVERRKVKPDFASASTVTLSPSGNSPSRMRIARASSIRFWRARRRGLAP